MKMKTKLLLVNCTPIVIFAIISLVLGLTQFSSSLSEKTEAYLKSTAMAALTMYSGRGYGDYSEKPDGNIWRGMNFNISTETSIVDDLKEQMGVDITVFFGEEAVMTSIFHEDGSRCTGMPVEMVIKKNTLERGYPLWCKSIMVNGEECQAYVIPIRQESDGTIVGALMASQSIRPFKWAVIKYVFTTMIAMVVILVMVFLFILRHIESFSQKFSEVTDKSKQDLLTGLYNKMSFEESARKLCEECHAEGVVGVLLILDFDNFKHVNDDYGHQVGDEALKGFARILKHVFRGNAVIGRVGGDEFMVFVKTVTHLVVRVDEQARIVLDELREMQIGEASHFSCSIGIGIDARCKYTFEELYQRADQALYQAKSYGKACFCKMS